MATSPFRLVERPFCRPFRCIALPHVGQQARNERWVDTGAEHDREHVYLSESAVTQAARLLGWVPGGDLALEHRRAVALSAEVDQLRAELAEVRAAWDAVDVIERNGMLAKGAT